MTLIYGLRVKVSSQIILKINYGTIVFSIFDIVMVQDIKGTAKILSGIKTVICILEDITSQKLNLSLLTSIMVFGLLQPMS